MSLNCFMFMFGIGNVRNDDEDKNIKEWMNFILKQVKLVIVVIVVFIN